MITTIHRHSLSNTISSLIELKNKRDNVKFTTYKLAQKTGVDRSIIQRIIKGEIENPRLDTFFKIINFFINDGFKINIENIAQKTGFGKINSERILDHKSSTLNLISEYFHITPDQLIGGVPLMIDAAKNIINVPIINSDKLKSSQDIFNKINYTHHDKWMLLRDHNGKDDYSFSLFATTLEGDSMLPYFDKETTLVIDRSMPIKSYKYVLAHIINGDEIVLRQIFIDGLRQILKPLNKKFQAIELSKGDRIIGTLVQTKREF
jgi:predicted transcriptional regulator